MKPFIRWFGNKTNYKKHILPYVPESYHTYIEPFVGSGSIFLLLRPQKWIINDIDTDLMRTWSCVKDHPDQLERILQVQSRNFAILSLHEKKRQCHKMVYALNHAPFSIQRVAYFILLRFYSYLGKIVQNNRFIFPGLDVKQKNKDQPSVLRPPYFTNLQEISRYLNSTQGHIMNVDYKIICRKAKPGDFVFLDPPYIEAHDYQFNYHVGERTPTQNFIRDLYREVQKLDRKKVKWIMTQADTKYIRDTFREYKIIEMPVYRQTRKRYESELIILGR